MNDSHSEHTTSSKNLSTRLLNIFHQNKILIVLLVLQVLLCAYGLFQHLFWVDEAFSAVMSLKSFSEIHQAMLYDAGPPLYYDLLHGWQFVFGASEVSLRGMSLLFSLITTVLIYRFCQERFSEKAALFSTLLWVCSPLSMFYSVEARNYTFFAALTLGYFILLQRFLYKPSYLYLFWKTLVLIIAVYTHNTAWFLFPIGMLSALILNRNRKTLLLLALSYLIVILCFIPWMPVFIQQMKNSELTIGWIKYFWSYSSIFMSFSTFIPGGNTLFIINLPQSNYGIQILNVILFSFIFLAALWKIHKSKSTKAYYILSIFVCGLLFPYLSSCFIKPTYLAGRTDFFIFPFWCILIGFGISCLKNRSVQYLLLSIIFFQSTTIDVLYYTMPSQVNERVLLKAIKYHVEDGDVIICTGLTRPFAEFYLRENGLHILSYPLDMENHLAHLNDAWYLKNMDLKQDAAAVMDHAFSTLQPQAKLIIIGSDRPINKAIYNTMKSSAYAKNKFNLYQPTAMGLRRLDEPIYLWIYQK